MNLQGDVGRAVLQFAGARTSTDDDCQPGDEPDHGMDEAAMMTVRIAAGISETIQKVAARGGSKSMMLPQSCLLQCSIMN